ncbi:MAG: hydantoinase B/oxoprolinase family protein [Opitutaceae bacterium]|nr:hydantoinase B/oxoprolinase family protein [Opitutaceae bacterium]
MAEARHWHFWMDTGGTFTDCLACDPTGAWQRAKVLSSGAVRARVTAVHGPREVELGGLAWSGDDVFAGWSVAPAATTGSGEAVAAAWRGATHTLVLDRDVVWPAGSVVDLSTGEEAPVVAMRLLTRTRAGAALPPVSLRLATTRGTNALLEGRGAPVVFFVNEGFADLLRIGDQRRPDLFAIRVEKPAPLHGPVVEVRGRLDAQGREITPLDLDAVRAAAREQRSAGYEVAAVALLHSYRDPAHERSVAQVLREEGFRHVSVSAELAPLIKIVPRAETAVVDATLAPVMERYLSGVAAVVSPERLFVMTSAGGLVRRAAYRPKDSLLSGPAGGVAGAAAVARRACLQRVITFDMGGTSTDVARFEGDFDYQFQHGVGAARIMAPALRVESVAAGGGSICRFDGAALVVGPGSAGARPGPACYGAGGPLTLTDVNLLLGRLDPARFGIPVFAEAAEAALAAVVASIASARGAAPSRDEVLRGFLDIADERMAEAVRRISVREGYDPAEYALVAFGGAGGLHACAVAGRLGIQRILYPADSGLLSAYGLGQAAEERIVERQVLRRLEDVSAGLDALLAGLEAEGRAHLTAAGAAAGCIIRRRAEWELRYAGQDAGLAVPAAPEETLQERFVEAYRRRFGYAPTGRAIEVVAGRVVVSTATTEAGVETFGPPDGAAGPRLVQDGFSTLHIAAGWRSRDGSCGSRLLERLGEDACGGGLDGTRDDVVELELFTHRFRAIVDEMGLLLQRCALSVNIKERLDFSCALLDAEGELVTNAPHVPVHLGALGLCVRRLREVLDLRAGDVAITNHPGYGGAHLPDVTLVAPVHADDGGLLGYVASRAHHAEIGGVRPGSMPPDARRLAEEGVILAPMLLVRAGRAAWQDVSALLRGGLYPSRRVDENIADLHAQLASIRLGVESLRALAGRAGAGAVACFMRRLKERAAVALAMALDRRGALEATATDALDDGTPIVVRLSRAGSGSRLRVDFSGSGDVHPGNLNATPAIVRSALIYVLRLVASCDLPLNEGLMRDVDLVLPEGVLSPPFDEDPARCPAVVGGNVETSQRVVDVLVRAFGLAACSQGTMNNLIFGNERVSYYETIGGGTGAGEGFSGCHGVHSHMTNTAITDPEVLELRLPVRLKCFALRRGSGGAGRFRGGDGLERVLEFLEPAVVSLLTQRRVSGPPGLAGGRAGAPGRQWIERASQGHRESLGSIAGTRVEPGDVLGISTPGGGGWGV